MNAKSKDPKSSTQGMEGEDFAYGGAGAVSDAKKPAVVSGEVKKTTDSTTPETPARGKTTEGDWGNRKEDQQVPGGVSAAERSKNSK